MPGFNVSGVGSGPSNNIHPFYTYTWEIETLFGSPGTSGPLIFAREMTLPSFVPKREEYESSSLVYKYAAQANWDDVRLTFYDIPDQGKLVDVLKEWRQRVWTPENGIGEASEYKKESTLKVFNMDQSENYSWKLTGSWPANIREGDLTYTDSDVKVAEVIVAYDWAEIE
jgi:hypothetical protein